MSFYIGTRAPLARRGLGDPDCQCARLGHDVGVAAEKLGARPHLRRGAALGVPGSRADGEGIRLLGSLVSIGIIASLFVSCRMLTGRVPLLAMALVPFNVAVFYFGSSIRPYGLAILLIIPCYAAFWRMARARRGGTCWRACCWPF